MSLSQAQVIGLPSVQSWDDYEHGCHSSFGGGYSELHEREIFRHGMSTVFNLLRGEFPPAEACKSAIGWQSIDTAPKGKTIIGWGAAVGVNLCRWDSAKEQWSKCELSAAYQLGPKAITHWVSLPETPNSRSELTAIGDGK